MTAPSSIDSAHFLHEQLAQASPDLLRQMLTTFINTLMSAEADAVCGAECGTRSAERTNTRDGYRHRDFDTRAGTLDVQPGEAALDHPASAAQAGAVGHAAASDPWCDAPGAQLTAVEVVVVA